MKLQRCLSCLLLTFVGCVAVDEDFRVNHEGVLVPRPVEASAEEANSSEPAHIGPWTTEELAVRAGRLSQAMREGEIEAVMARIKADADTAWKDPEFRYNGRWGDGTSDSFDRAGESTWHLNQFGARVYIPNPFVNRYLTKKGDADVRRCEARAEAKAYAVYTEVKLLCAEYLRSGREITLLERKAELLKQVRELNETAASNFVARSPYAIIRSETQLTRNAVKLEMLRSSREVLRRNLATLAQVSVEGFEIVAENPTDPESLSLDRLCELAFVRRPDLAQAIAEYDLAVASKSAAKVAYIPWFRFVEAAYRDERGSDVKRPRLATGSMSGDDSKDHDFAVELAITIPLFTWCGDSVKKSDRMRRLADARVRSLRDSIRGEIAAALEGYRSAVTLNRMVFTDFGEKMAKRIDEAAKDQGAASVDEYLARIELLEHELLKSEIAAVVAESRIRLESAVGGPLL